MWFYKVHKDEKNRNLVVEYNTLMTYITKSIGVIGVMFCFFNLYWMAIPCLLLLAALLSYYLYKHGNLVRLLHAEEKLENLSYIGSRYSFSDPLIIRIPLPRDMK